MVSGAAGWSSDGSMIAVFIEGGPTSDVFPFCKGEGMRGREIECEVQSGVVRGSGRE